jgi:hypothetical protein
VGLTLFSIPKPFVGHVGVIQRNAIESWKRLGDAEVLLFGEEEGLAEAAAQASVRHEREIARNAAGTPLVSDAFDRARSLAHHDSVVFVNTDIVLTSDLARAIDVMERSAFANWVMVGQRHDLDVREPIAMDNGWEGKLRGIVASRGVLHGRSGIDFFAFPRTLPVRLPPLAVGRVGWDSWLIYAIRSAGIPLVDATRAVCTIHQNHPPAHSPVGAEAMENRAAAGGYYRMGSLRDADWQLVAGEDGGITLSRRWLGNLWFSPPLRAGLAVKREFSRKFTGSRV